MREHFPLIGSIAWVSSARAYGAFTTLVGLILTVRWLGAEGRGVVVVINTWVGLCAQLGCLTLWNVAVHRSASAPGKSWLGPFLGASLILCAISTVTIWLVIGFLFTVQTESLFAGIPGTALAIGFLALPFWMWEVLSSNLLSLVGRLQVHNLNQIIARTLGLIALAIAIPWVGLGIYGFVLALVLTEFIIAAVALTVLVRECRPDFVAGLRQLPGIVADALKGHLVLIGTILFSAVDILLVHHFEGAAKAAVYQFASAMFLTFTLVPQAALLAIQGRVSSLGLQRSWPEQRFMIGLTIAGMAAVMAVVWLMAPWLTVTLATRDFAEAASPLRIMVMALPAIAFTVMMMVQWSARGRFLGLGLMFLAMGLLSLGLNLLLIPRFGLVGAAWTAVIVWCTIPVMANLPMALKAHREAVEKGTAKVAPIAMDTMGPI